MVIYCQSLPQQQTRKVSNIYHKSDLIYLDLNKSHLKIANHAFWTTGPSLLQCVWNVHFSVWN